MTLMAWISKVFDTLHHFWESPKVERSLGLLLLWIYLLTLCAVELKRMGFYPLWLPQPPESHYFSIQLAFTMILLMEIISLIFILPASLSNSIAKQLEILTLILLRNAFKELSLLPEPVAIDFNNLQGIINIAGSAGGALCVFMCLGLFRIVMRQHDYIKNHEMLVKYIQCKKVVSFVMLLIFIYIGCLDIWYYYLGRPTEFFETIYTVLIFADIAMVIVAQRYMPCYQAVFRNSGFVIGTLIMRLSLSAPALLSAALAITASVYVLILAWGINRFRRV